MALHEGHQVLTYDRNGMNAPCRAQSTAPLSASGPATSAPTETRLSVRDLPFQSAVDQLSALASGEVSSEELLEVYLSRIDAHNQTLNAIVALDVERARSAARKADEKRASGAELGPLHGLPITLKDSYE